MALNSIEICNELYKKIKNHIAYTDKFTYMNFFEFLNFNYIS